MEDAGSSCLARAASLNDRTWSLAEKAVLVRRRCEPGTSVSVSLTTTRASGIDDADLVVVDGPG